MRLPFNSFPQNANPITTRLQWRKTCAIWKRIFRRVVVLSSRHEQISWTKQSFVIYLSLRWLFGVSSWSFVDERVSRRVHHPCMGLSFENNGLTIIVVVECSMQLQIAFHLIAYSQTSPTLFFLFRNSQSLLGRTDPMKTGLAFLHHLIILPLYYSTETCFDQTIQTRQIPLPHPL